MEHEQFIARLNPRAQKDLLEWEGDRPLSDLTAEILKRRMSLENFARTSSVPPLTDDNPLNKYFMLRRANSKILNESWTLY